MPFKPAGEVARWRIVYDLLRKASVDQVITYEEMGAALDLDPDAARHVIQMAVRRAAREHEVADGRALDVVPNAGYRIVTVPEHLTLAKRHHKKASRSLARGQSKVEHVDLTGVDPETRRAFEVVALAFQMQADFNRRVESNQKKLARQVSAAASAQERTAEELADLRSRLARLESEIAETPPDGAAG
jgi:siderophore synthetase component